jgi:hypothetical protein
MYRLPSMKRILTVILALAVGLFAACGRKATSWSSPEITGKVVDAASGKPIQGAIVVANWQLTTVWENYPLGQLDIEEVVSDRNGQFKIPAWGPKSASEGQLEKEEPHIRIYKPGYVPLIFDNRPSGVEPYNAEEAAGKIVFRHNGETFELEPLSGPPSEQALAINKLIESMTFARFGSNCEWKSVPRILIALSKARDELRYKAPNVQVSDSLLLAGGPDKCGNPRDFFRPYSQ